MSRAAAPASPSRPATHPSFESDLCVKCNICTAACPVAGVTLLFPGPKAVGPQAARYSSPAHRVIDPATAWCSGCGVCSRVCPHAVPVAEMNIVAKAELLPGPRLALRDWGISRPSEVARWMRLIRPLASLALRSRVLRALADVTLGLARHAPLPAPAARSLRRRRSDLVHGRPLNAAAAPDRPRVAYFHGCSTEDYEPWLGETAIEVLEHLGVDVELPPQECCGLPLQSNHALARAGQRARRNLASLAPWADHGIPIVGTSTSCTLALKHEYRAVLGISGAGVDSVASNTYDFFEYLEHLFGLDRIEPRLQPLPLHVLYHAPCQLRAHGVGAPALKVLRAIPELRLEVSQAECCGVAGTYGLKSERYEVATAVGRELFDQVQSSPFDRVVTDSETCRWWIEAHSQVPAVHPVELLAESLGLPGRRPRGSGPR